VRKSRLLHCNSAQAVAVDAAASPIFTNLFIDFNCLMVFPDGLARPLR